jgi:ABC-type uncharacterized transport system permease subunit
MGYAFMKAVMLLSTVSGFVLYLFTDHFSLNLMPGNCPGSVCLGMLLLVYCVSRIPLVSFKLIVSVLRLPISILQDCWEDPNICHS